MATTPSAAARSARLAAPAWPRARRRSRAFSISPPASTRAFLASIMPAPVWSRSWPTIWAVICVMAYLLMRDACFVLREYRISRNTKHASRLGVYGVFFLIEGGSSLFGEAGHAGVFVFLVVGDDDVGFVTGSGGDDVCL